MVWRCRRTRADLRDRFDLYQVGVVEYAVTNQAENDYYHKGGNPNDYLCLAALPFETGNVLLG
jgi:hypothetical protein